MSTAEPHSWRSLLGKLIRSDAGEKQRLADALGVNPKTLVRWASLSPEEGASQKPRLRNLQDLVAALPQYREQLTSLIRKEFPDFAPRERVASLVGEIPSALYDRVLEGHASLADPLRFWSLCEEVLTGACGILDPDERGIEALVVQCMPPAAPEQKVQSLREVLGLGTPPWSRSQQQKSLYLGSESLAGYAVGSFQPAVVQDIAQGQGLLPIHQVENEQSAAAYVILRAGRVAGCLLVSSREPNFFTDARQALLQKFANLLALAFDPCQFYEQQAIALRKMPPFQMQQPYLVTLQQRITAIQRQDAEPLSLERATLLAYQDLERIFLSLN